MSFFRTPVLSYSRSVALPFLTSFCGMVVLSHCRPLRAFSQILRVLLDSWILVLSHFRPRALSSSCTPVPHIVLWHCGSLGAFSQILRFSSSRPLVPHFVLSHCRSPLPLHPWSLRKEWDQLKSQEDLAYILGHWRTSRSVHTLGGELPLVLDCTVLC